MQFTTHGGMHGRGGMLQDKGTAGTGWGLAHGELSGRDIEYEDWRFLERPAAGHKEGSDLPAKPLHFIPRTVRKH